MAPSGKKHASSRPCIIPDGFTGIIIYKNKEEHFLPFASTLILLQDWTFIVIFSGLDGYWQIL